MLFYFLKFHQNVEIYVDNQLLYHLYPSKNNSLSKTVGCDWAKAFLNEDPSRIAGLHNDIKTGVFDKVLPLAEKKAMVDGYNAPFLQYYLQAGQEILNANNRPIQTEQKQFVPPENRANKIAAGLPSSRGDKKSVIDYLDEEISDEDYKEWYSKLQRRV